MCLDRRLRQLTLEVIVGKIKDSTTLRDKLVKVIEEETGVEMSETDVIRATHAVDELFTDWRIQKKLNEEVAEEFVNSKGKKTAKALFTLLKKKYEENGIPLSWDNIKKSADDMGINIDGGDDVQEGYDEGFWPPFN